MKKVLYLGNKLSKYGYTPTTIETLGPRLSEDYELVSASGIKNKPLRLLHMLWMVWTNRHATYLLIDTYSTSAFTFAWSSARLARMLNLKYIPILHGGDLPKRMARKPGRLTKYLNHAEKVVCPSDYLKIEMACAVNREYEVIPNFIDLSNYPYKRRKISRHEPIRLFWLRSFHKIYNPNLAIELLKSLIDRGYSCQLCMVGPDKDGSMSEVRNYAQKLGIDDFLEIKGKLSKPDWITLSRAFSVFINTTDVDNTPVSVMEAMALGFPVVTTNAGGISCLLEDGVEGIVVLPGRVDLFVEAIENLLKNEERCLEMSAAARRKSESWDWQSIRLSWKQLLD